MNIEIGIAPILPENGKFFYFFPRIVRILLLDLVKIGAMWIRGANKRVRRK